MKLINDRKILLYLFLFFILILSACVNKSPTQILPDSTKPSQITPTIVTSTNTVIPTEIPQPKTIFLLTTGENNSGELTTIKNNLLEYSKSNEFNLEIANKFDSDLLKSSELVIMFEPEENWIEESRQLPKTNFIFISEKTLELADNSYQIKTLPAEYYFMAGYLSAVASEDWRVGALVSENIMNNVPTSELFSNGMHFLCGLCFPVYAPLVSFPVTANLGLPEDASASLAAYGEISASRPKTIFIDSAYLTKELFTTLKNDGITIISNKSENLDLDVSPDIVIYQEISDVLSDLLISLNNAPSKIMTADIIINSNSAILSTGKLNFLNVIIDDLRQGYIFPYSVQE